MNTNDNSTPLVNWVLKALRALPKWLRMTIILAIAVIAGILCTGIVGCGSVMKINVASETPGKVDIKVSQNRSDSIGVIVNPTINFPYNGKKNETSSE